MEPDTANQGAAILPDWLGGIALLLAAAFGLAWLFRRAGFPGAAAVGGVLAGLLLGPGVLGRAAPAMHDRLFGAAPAERAAWRDAERAVDATQFVVGQAEVDPASARAQVETLVGEAEARKAAWNDAAERKRRPFLMLAFALGLAVLLASSLARPEGNSGESEAKGRAIMLGAWSAFLPAVLAAVGLSWLGEPAWSPTMLAAMSAVAIGAWPLVATDREPLRDSVPGGLATLRTAALAANAIAIGFLGASAIVASHPLATLGLAGAAVAVVLVPPLVRSIGSERRSMAAIPILVPPLAALAAVRIEPFLDLRWAPVIVLPLVAEDGRWLGGTLGAWLPGGVRFPVALRVGLASIPAGPGMVATIAIGLQAGVLAPTVGGGLLVGVLLIEILAPIRGRFAADLARTETGTGTDDRTGS